jgi:hypothetical protein
MLLIVTIKMVSAKMLAVLNPVLERKVQDFIASEPPFLPFLPRAPACPQLLHGDQLFFQGTHQAFTKSSCGYYKFLVSLLQTDGHIKVWFEKVLNTWGFDFLKKRKM